MPKNIMTTLLIVFSHIYHIIYCSTRLNFEVDRNEKREFEPMSLVMKLAVTG